MQLAIKQLAVAVIQQAFLDLERPSLRVPAMKFINSEDLEFWTGILEINPDMLREKAKTMPIQR